MGTTVRLIVTEAGVNIVNLVVGSTTVDKSVGSGEER